MPRKPLHFIDFMEKRNGSNPNSSNSRTVPVTASSSPQSRVSTSPSSSATPTASPPSQQRQSASPLSQQRQSTPPLAPNPPPAANPPPPADNLPPPNALYDRINQLLRQEGHDHLRILHPGPDAPPDTWWFAKDNKVSRSVTSCIQGYFHEPHANWTQTSQRIRDIWFESFAQKWHWEEVYTPTVHATFCKKGIKRLAGTVSNLKKKWKKEGDDAQPRVMAADVWRGLVQYWTDPQSVKVSTSCSLARTSPDENGELPSVHSSGQSSYLRRQIDMAKGGELPPIGEVLLVTHKRKNGSFVDSRSERVYNDYHSRVTERETQLSSDGSTVGLSLQEKDNIYMEVAPRKKNRIYDVGSISDQGACSSGRRRSHHTHLEAELKKTKDDLESAKFDLQSVMKIIAVIAQESPTVREKMQEEALEREKRHAAEEARREEEMEDGAEQSTPEQQSSPLL